MPKIFSVNYHFKILNKHLLVQLGKLPDHVPLAVHCLTEGPERIYPSRQE